MVIRNRTGPSRPTLSFTDDLDAAGAGGHAPATARRRVKVGQPKVKIGLKQVVVFAVNGVDIELPVTLVGSVAARSRMPTLIRESAENGSAFLIGNEKTAGAPAALLVNPDVLQANLSRSRPKRTVGEVLDNLPFGRKGTPRIVAKSPDDVAETVRLPLAQVEQGAT